MKPIAILGSTGSIGQSTLRVVRHLKDRLSVKALAAHSNIDLLYQQAIEFQPEIIAVWDQFKALELKKMLPGMHVVGGMEGVCEAAAHPSVQFVVSAMVGTAGLLPTMTAVKHGKQIGLANKEVLVAAGELITKLAQEHGAQLLPIDSEHSALFQCLDQKEMGTVRRLILTASGGPFLNFSEKQLENVTLEDSLKHPNWKMGAKVTIDCSTLMNKGLEVIEARWLFNLPVEQIEVVVHPQSLIHSLVEFIDGSILAQMSHQDMILPIQYALTYPDRLAGILPPFDFTKYNRLELLPPDWMKFPCLRLAVEAIKQGGSAPCFLNAANEVMVSRFIQKEISWRSIGVKLEKLMESHQVAKQLNLETILEVDASARECAKII